MLPPRGRPRYLPTLTHVITESDLLHIKSGGGASPGSALNLASSANAQEVVDLLIPKLMILMREELQTHLELQLHQLEAKIRLEAESMVRAAMNRCGDLPAD